MRLMNTAAQVPFVLTADRDPATGEARDDATTFMLRCLSATENGALDDSLVNVNPTIKGTTEDTMDVEIGGMQFSMSTRNINRVRLGLCGWDGLTDPDTGEEIPFTQEPLRIGGRRFMAVPLSVVDRFPPEAIKELSSKIGEIASLSAKEGN